MANNKSIQILRGSRQKVSQNKGDLLPGQPLFDKTDNYLLIGQDDAGNNKQPITTNRIKGYYGDISGINGSSGSYPYSLGATDSGTSDYTLTLDAKSGKLILQTTNKDININTSNSGNSIIIHGDDSEGIDINGDTTIYGDTIIDGDTIIKGDIIKFQNSNDAEFFVANKSESTITISYNLEVSGNIIGDLTGTATKVSNSLTFQDDSSNQDTYDGSESKTLIGKVVDMFTNQNVGGVKTFEDGIIAPTLSLGTLQGQSSNSNITLKNSIVPDDSDVDLGDETKKFGTIYANEVVAHISGTITGDNIEIPGSIQAAKDNNKYLFTVSNGSGSIGKVSASSLQVGVDSNGLASNFSVSASGAVSIGGNIVPYSNNKHNLGDDSHLFSTAYITTTNSNNIYSPNIIGGDNTSTSTVLTLKNNNTPNSSIVLDNNGIQLNGNSTIQGNIIPKNNEQYTLGTSTRKFSYIYSSKISGKLNAAYTKVGDISSLDEYYDFWVIDYIPSGWNASTIYFITE